MFTNYFENLLLNHMLGGAAYTNPATWYLALYTATPGEAGGGTECTGGAYARVALTNNTTNFPTTTTSSKSLGVAAAFAEATNNWGTITGFALCDASSGGNICLYGNLTAPIVISQGDVARIAVGGSGITMTLD
jgi:hypothetical protein